MLVKDLNSEYWQVLILGIAFRWTLMLVYTDRSLIAGRIVKTEQFWLPSRRQSDILNWDYDSHWMVMDKKWNNPLFNVTLLYSSFW